MLTGFEVGNTLCSRQRAQNIASTVPGVANLCPTEGDAFCSFELEGIPFEIIEPFGDNDCYWIVAVNPDVAHAPLIVRVRHAFEVSPAPRVTAGLFAGAWTAGWIAFWWKVHQRSVLWNAGSAVAVAAMIFLFRRVFRAAWTGQEPVR